MNNEIKYFAAKEAKDTAEILLKRANSWYSKLHSNNYFTTIQRSWMAYYGMFYDEAHKVTFGGEQGELSQMSVNHYQNIANHMLTMITSTKPTFMAKSANTDNKSTIQSKLATSLLEYYMRDKNLEKYLKKACEYALVMGSGYIKMEWNASVGQVYEVDDDTGEETREGDVEFKNMTPFDVLFDTSRETENQDWVMCRTFKSKYDLAAKFPDFRTKIEDLKTKSDYYRFVTELYEYDETDDVPVYEFYHKKTEALPEGRYLLFLAEDIVLIDQANPYSDLPVYRIAARDILGTSYGYSPMFPLLEIQDVLNATHSAIVSNQSTFAVQSVFVKRGSDISPKSLEGGLNIIEGNEAPEPIQLTKTPPEVFEYAAMLEQQMETISGISSVTRGNPEASLKSGTALALVQATSLQYISGLQQQYIRMQEDVGTGLINLLKSFAKVPRVIMIAGIANRGYIEKEFTGDAISDINRVTIEVGNPLSQTHAGRVQMATDLLQYNLIKSPQQYISVVTTGRLDVMTDPIERNNNLIRAENERMMLGVQAKVLATDNHVQHIQEHQSILADPDMRDDEEISAIVLAHMQEHIRLMRETDPGLLQILGIPVLPPNPLEQPPMQQAPPGQMPQDPNATEQLMQSQAPVPEQGPLAPIPPAAEAPGMPNTPQVDGSLLPNPAIQETMMGNVK